MAGPWEKYQTSEAEAKPWERYGAEAPPAKKPSNWMGLPEPGPEAQALIQAVKKQGWGSGWPKVAYDLGGKVTDVTGSPAAGYAANVLTEGLPSFLTSGSVRGGNPVLGGLGRWLMQSAVKPSTDDLLSGNAAKAIDTMLEYRSGLGGWRTGIKPTAAGMQVAAQRSAQLDDQVGKAIATSTAEVPVAGVTQRLVPQMDKARMQVNPSADVGAVENAWTQFLQNPEIAGKASIPVQLAHDMKKGTYAALGGKSYGEVGSTSVEAQKQLARGLREEVMEAVPAIKTPLAEQAALMNVRDVAGARALLESNKNPLGLAGLRIDHPLSAASFMADRSAWLKAFLALQMYHGSMPGTLSALGTSGGLGVLSGQPQDGILRERR